MTRQYVKAKRSIRVKLPKSTVARLKRQQRMQLYRQPTLSMENSMSVPTNRNNILGQSRSFKFRYVQQDNLNAGTAVGSFSETIFRLNSLNDPYYTGVGHQPMGFDQISALFDHYLVYGAKVNVTLIPSSSSPTSSSMVVMYPSRGSGTTASNQEQACEQTSSCYTHLVGQDGVKNLSAYYNIRKELGIKNTGEDGRLQTTTTANPTEELFLVIQAHNPDGQSVRTQDPMRVDILVDITYYATMREKMVLPQS